MPFKSEKQRKYMYAKHPEIAKRWQKEGKMAGYGKPTMKKAASKRAAGKAAPPWTSKASKPAGGKARKYTPTKRGK